MKDRFKLIDYNGHQTQSFKPSATTSEWKTRPVSKALQTPQVKGNRRNISGLMKKSQRTTSSGAKKPFSPEDIACSVGDYAQAQLIDGNLHDSMEQDCLNLQIKGHKQE